MGIVRLPFLVALLRLLCSTASEDASSLPPLNDGAAPPTSSSFVPPVSALLPPIPPPSALADLALSPSLVARLLGARVAPQGSGFIHSGVDAVDIAHPSARNNRGLLARTHGAPSFGYLFVGRNR